MATLSDLKANTNTTIRTKAAPASVTRDAVANALDAGYEFTDKAFYLRERQNGRYWITDPEFLGGCLANNAGAATENSNAFDALYAAIGNEGATICVPLAKGGPFWFARPWVISKRSVGIVGQSSGWRSGEYSDKRQTGSHLRFQTDSARCIEYTPDPNLQPTYDGYLTGVLVEDLLITSTGGRDSGSVGLYVGTSDHAKISRVAVLDCGLAVHLHDCDSPTVDACQVCENGQGVLAEGGFYARILNTISADQAGKLGNGTNAGFGVYLLNTRGAVVTGNIFARNKVSLWLNNSTYCTVGGNSYAETLGAAVRLQNSNYNNLVGGSASDTKDYAVQLMGSNRNTIEGFTAQTGSSIPNVYLDSNSGFNQVLDCVVNVGYLDNNTSGANSKSTNFIRDNFGLVPGTGTGGGGNGGGSGTGSLHYTDIPGNDSSLVLGGAGWMTNNSTLYNNTGYNQSTGTFDPSPRNQYVERTANSVVGFLINGESGPLACDNVLVTIADSSGTVVQTLNYSQYSASAQTGHTLFNSLTAAGGSELPVGTYTIRALRYGDATMALDSLTLVRRY